MKGNDKEDNPVKILITGSAGLVGRAVSNLLKANGCDVTHFDIADRAQEDVRNRTSVMSAVSDVDGVIHLAAVSRVVWAQNNPELCRSINKLGVRNVLDAIERSAQPPWLIFASSREVYGQQETIPVKDDADLRPMNVYARSKVFAEQEVARLAADGFVANSVRLSNVYGCPMDHPDRVVPAFAHASATGAPIRIEGKDNSFDFTHISDVAEGIVKLAMLAAGGATFSPLHLTTGQQTTLDDLANLALVNARRPVQIYDAPPRDYDVANFCGSTTRARDVLGWTSSTSIEDGFADLVARFQKMAA